IDSQRVNAFRRNLREEPAEFLAETQMRADNRQRFGIEIWHIDRVADRSFKERCANRLRNLNSDVFLRYGSGSAEMRRENKIRRRAKRRISGQRLGLENVDRRGGNMSILQRIRERGFVDETPPRTIDDAHAAFCPSQTHCVKNVSRF